MYNGQRAASSDPSLPARSCIHNLDLNFDFSCPLLLTDPINTISMYCPENTNAKPHSNPKCHHIQIK
jgi:hypothetical protein